MHTYAACACFGAVTGFLFFTPQVVASPVLISDEIVIKANGATAGAFSSFSALDQTFTEADEVAGLVNPFTFVVGVRSGIHNATFDTAVELTEPDGTVSDIIDFHLVANSSGVQTVTLNFFSDTEGGPALQPPAGAFVVTTAETGGLQDISSLFLNSKGVQGTDIAATIEVQSDAVPEPTTLALLATGILGFRVMHRKRKLRAPLSKVERT